MPPGVYIIVIMTAHLGTVKHEIFACKASGVIWRLDIFAEMKSTGRDLSVEYSYISVRQLLREI